MTITRSTEQIWEYSAWWGMVETELRSTDEIPLGRMLMSHRQPSDHMVKYLQGISALRPMSFISGNLRLCPVGLRKFQILYHFTFGDLEFRATRLILIPRSPCQSLHCSTLNWLHGDLLEDREHSWGFWSHIWKNVGKAYFLIFLMLRNLRLSARRHLTVVMWFSIAPWASRESSSPLFITENFRGEIIQYPTTQIIYYFFLRERINS